MKKLHVVSNWHLQFWPLCCSDLFLNSHELVQQQKQLHSTLDEFRTRNRQQMRFVQIAEEMVEIVSEVCTDNGREYFDTIMLS
jgi:hypothetical protein